MYILYLSKIHVLTRPSTRTHVCSSNRVPRTTLWVRVTLVIAIPTGIVVAVRFGPTVYSFIHRAAELVTSFEVIITRAGATLPTESTRGRTTRPRLSRGHHPALRVGRRRRRHAARVVPHLEPPDGATSHQEQHHNTRDHHHPPLRTVTDDSRGENSSGFVVIDSTSIGDASVFARSLLLLKKIHGVPIRRWFGASCLCVEERTKRLIYFCTIRPSSKHQPQHQASTRQLLFQFQLLAKIKERTTAAPICFRQMIFACAQFCETVVKCCTKEFSVYALVTLSLYASKICTHSM